MISKNLSSYKLLESELFKIRRKNGGNDSADEAIILDKMDGAWNLLSIEEINYLKTEEECSDYSFIS